MCERTQVLMYAYVVEVFFFWQMKDCTFMQQDVSRLSFPFVPVSTTTIFVLPDPKDLAGGLLKGVICFKNFCEGKD